jgi:Zn-dependent protease
MNSLSFEFWQYVQALQQQKPNSNTWSVLLISLVLFAALGLFQWEWQSLILLIIALGIHELGHLLGMKIFRYTNLKMLFIPLLGALASGIPSERNATKIALISLAGPGIGFVSALMAWGVWMLYPSDLLLEFIYLSMVLNLFNLLPINPLDGGHYISETLFNKYPKVELVFRILSIATLIGLAIWMEIWILGLVCFFMLATVFGNYLVGAVSAKMRQSQEIPTELNEEFAWQLREAVITHSPALKEEKNLSGVAIYVLRIWNQLDKTLPKTWQSLGLLALYLCSFGLMTGITILFIIVHRGALNFQ